MSRSVAHMLTAALVLLAPAACSGARGSPAGGTPAAGTSSAGGTPAEVHELTLARGAVLELRANAPLTSRHNHAGDPVTARSVAPALDAAGDTVIPAGAEFFGTVEAIAPAPNPHSQGRLVLAFTRFKTGGASRPLEARVVSVTTHLQGRGVTGGTVAKVGAGAAIGGLAGRLIGGNTTGALVGAAAGGAAGGVYAHATRNLDVVMDAGAPIRIALTEPLVMNK